MTYCAGSSSKIILKITYFLERQSYRESQGGRETERGSSIHCFNSQSWAHPKSGAKSFFKVSKADVGARGLRPSSLASLGELAGS